MTHLRRFIALGMTVATVACLIPMTTLAASYGWVEKDGKWYYYDSEGVKVKRASASRFIDGEYKYFVLNSKGVMVTQKGWYTTNYVYSRYGNKIKYQNKYYIKSDGSCTTGWKKISGKWYYFLDDGKMARNEAINKPDSAGNDRYYLVGKDGKRITKKGWHQVTDKSLSSYGIINTEKYWYFVKTDGTVARNCVKKIGKKKYLFYDNGVLVTNDYGPITNKDGSVKYYYAADKNGVVITKKGKYTLKNKVAYKSVSYSYDETYDSIVYVKTGGKLHMGWKTIKGKKYYFDPYAYRCTIWTIDGVKYYFGRSGAVTKEIKQET